ncbi:MFS transporter [Azoarcus indigens]|nr:MFS transporter [Azoarcus indigens]
MERPVPSADAASGETGAPPWRIFLIASAAVFLVSIDSTVLFAAFAALREAFPANSAAGLSWVLNAYTVVYAAMLVPAGRLADTHGRKRMFMTGVGVFSLASLACGLAPDVMALVAARVLQAVGAALLMPASLAIVLGAFPLRQRAVAVSMWGAVGGLAAAAGPSVGAWLVDGLGWRWAFFINLPPALWSLWRARRQLPAEGAPASGGRRFDAVGVALLVAGVGALTWAVVSFEAHPWRSPQVAGAASLGLLLMAGFVAWARGRADAALDLSLFSSRTYRAVNLATLVFGAAFAMMFFGFFFFMTGIWHYSLPLAGLAITPGPLMVVPVALLCGRLAARTGHRPVLVGGCLLLAAGGIWQSLVPGVQPQYLTHWLPSQLMTGIGVGMAMPSLAGAAVASLGSAQYGVGSAVNQAIRQFGTVLGVAWTIVVLGHAQIGLEDFRLLSRTYAALALLSAVLCLAVHTRPPGSPAGRKPA